MDVYRPALALKFHAPEDIQYLIPGHHTVPVFPESQQAVEFHGLQGYLHPILDDRPFLLIDDYVFDAYLLRILLEAAQNFVYPHQKLKHLKRFDDIVLRAAP